MTGTTNTQCLRPLQLHVENTTSQSNGAHPSPDSSLCLASEHQIPQQTIKAIFSIKILCKNIQRLLIVTGLCVTASPPPLLEHVCCPDDKSSIYLLLGKKITEISQHVSTTGHIYHPQASVLLLITTLHSGTFLQIINLRRK